MSFRRPIPAFLSLPAVPAVPALFTLALLVLSARSAAAHPAKTSWREYPAPQPKRAMTFSEAVETLRYSDTFATERVGLAEVIPAEATAFWTIHQTEDAAAAFESLLDAPTIAGRLYGLAGLYLADTRTFAMVLERYSTEGRGVMTARGPFASFVPCRSVAARIESGEAPKLLLRMGEEAGEPGRSDRHASAATPRARRRAPTALPIPPRDAAAARARGGRG